MKATNITNLRIRTFMKQVQSKRNFHDFLFNIRSNFRSLNTILIEIGDARPAQCNMGILRGFVDMEFNYTFGNDKSDAEHYEDVYGAFISEINETLACKGKLLTVFVSDGNETAERWLWEDEKWKKEKPKFISRYFATTQRRRTGARKIGLLATE